MDIKLYTFGKKTNSTKQPTDAGTTKTGILLEPFSLDRLTVKFQLASGTSVTTSAPSYNYAYISMFSRYYFITGWTYKDGFWFAAMDEDHLATYKTNIGNSEQYVVRAASTYDSAIIDTRYNVLPQVTQSIYTPNTTNIWGLSFDEFIATSNYYNTSHKQILVSMAVMSTKPATSNDDHAIQIRNDGIDPYLLDETRHGSLMFVTTFQGLRSFLKLISRVNPSITTPNNIVQFVQFIRWYPFQLPYYGDNSTDQIVPGWNLDAPNMRITKVRIAEGLLQNQVLDFDANGVEAYMLKGSIRDFDWSINLPDSTNNYKNCEPFTSYSIKMDPFGQVPISSRNLLGGSTLNIKVKCDIMNNSATMYYGKSASLMEEIATTRLGVEFFYFGQNENKATSAANIAKAASIAATVAAAPGTGLGEAMLASTVAGIGGVVANSLGNSSFVGTAGASGVTVCDKYPVLMSNKVEDIEHDDERYGRPLCKKKIINTLSGFVQCDLVHVDFAIPENEKVAIINYLQSGFYYE